MSAPHHTTIAAKLADALSPHLKYESKRWYVRNPTDVELEHLRAPLVPDDVDAEPDADGWVSLVGPMRAVNAHLRVLANGPGLRDAERRQLCSATVANAVAARLKVLLTVAKVTR